MPSDAEVQMAIIKTGGAAYAQLLDLKRTATNEQNDKLQKIYDWGCALGNLIRIVKDDSADEKRINTDKNAFIDKLRADYTKHYENLNNGLIKPEFDQAKKDCNNCFANIVNCHQLLLGAAATDFENAYGNSDFSTLLPTAHTFVESKSLSFVLDTVVFHTYHMASLIMFRHGLLEGSKKVEEQNPEVNKYKVLFKVTSDVGVVFTGINNLVKK